MKRALRLALKGAGQVNPNPMVGAVLVSDGEIIGEGNHEFFGGPHAEVNAISDACLKSPEKIKGSILYVTLEPCCHTGKTPPCTDLIIAKGISTVFVGMEDPNELVAGKGIQILRDAGIEVLTGVLERECRQLNEVFIKYITARMPFVTLKSAMTLDGKIATTTNASRWITGEKSRNIVHQMRKSLSAVMVGADTVIADDPLLNIRLTGQHRQPIKIVTDSTLRIPLTSRLLTNDPQLVIMATTDRASRERVKEFERLGAQVVVCSQTENRVDLASLMKLLGAMDIDSILLEGGSTLAFSFLKARLVDKIVCFVAPKLLGGATAPSPVGGDGFPTMEEAVILQDMTYRKTGVDLMIQAYTVYPDNKEKQ